MGLRIVATSTRVRLFVPVSVPAGDRLVVITCAGRTLMMEEVDDATLVAERIAALDLGKATLEACVRVRHEQQAGRRMQELRGYGERDVRHLAVRRIEMVELSFQGHRRP